MRVSEFTQMDIPTLGSRLSKPELGVVKVGFSSGGGVTRSRRPGGVVMAHVLSRDIYYICEAI